MQIRIDPHTQERAEERGASAEEIRDVIQSGFEIPAKHNRKGRAKIYTYKKDRNGRYYEQKRIEIFYLIENEIVVTITVYVFYGKWEA